jgi:signal transduction histidine kinase
VAPRHRQAFRVRMPARTVRLRLALLYGCLFLASGAALLAITYGLVDSRLSNLRVSSGSAPGGTAGGQVHASSRVGDSLRAQQTADLHQFLVQSGIALAIMAVVSVALGWLMAGRTLRPLRAMTAATRRISERNLHERLALTGPGDEVKDLADTIDGLLARLDAAFDSQRRFVANASHELRTPLMLTQTLLQVALADPAITLGSLSAACQEVLLTCKEQDRLIQALLTLARSQRGMDHREPLDLAEITRQVLDSRGPEAAARGVLVDAALAPAPVMGDPRLVEILVSNLIENATRHNVPGGRIRVAAGARQAHAVLTVSNTGPHVPADQVERLLQPFQHLDGERGHSHEGLGLGLSIVAAIATAHGATLSVHPQPAGGLTVEVGFCTADTTVS